MVACSGAGMVRMRLGSGCPQNSSAMVAHVTGDCAGRTAPATAKTVAGVVVGFPRSRHVSAVRAVDNGGRMQSRSQMNTVRHVFLFRVRFLLFRDVAAHIPRGRAPPHARAIRALLGGPAAGGAVACVPGATFSVWLVRRKGLRWGRRLAGIGGLALAAGGFGLAATAGDALSAMLRMAFAQGAQDLTLPVAWPVCVDVGHRHGGTATGFTNTASSASAMISPISAAWLAARFGSLASMCWAAAVVCLVGAMLWFGIDPERRVRH